MKLVQVHLENLSRKIEEVKSRDWQSEEQKYLEVCAAYATMMTLFTKHSDRYTLQDLKPLADMFDKYQDEYLDMVL